MNTKLHNPIYLCTAVALMLFTSCEEAKVELAIGDSYGGGVIFYLDETGEHGLICAPKDIGTSTWSNVRYEGLGSSAQSTSEGSANTTAIVSQSGHTLSAAKLCTDFVNDDLGTGVYTDWYLPAKSELNLLFQSKSSVNAKLSGDTDYSRTVILVDDNYWSSTEYSESQAIYQKFATGQQLSFDKNYSYRVRPIRAF